MRYLVPLILFGAAGFIWYYNETHEMEWLLVPFLDAVPSLSGDRDAQAEWSWRIMAGIGVLSLVMTIVGDIRHRQRTRPSE